MTVQVYSIYDIKSAVYQQPFFAHKHGQAMRMIMEGIKQGEAMFAKYPEDFRLFAVGEWDDETGTMAELSQPDFVCELADLKE